MNFIVGHRQTEGLRLPDGTILPVSLDKHSANTVTLGLRASNLRLHAGSASVANLSINGVVQLAEISGSDTFVYTRTPWGELVAQLAGIHHFQLGDAVTLHASAADIYVFDDDGALLHAPAYAPARRRDSAGG